MTLTIAQIKNAEPVLGKMINTSLPVKVSFRIGKLVAALSKDIEQFEKYRVDLFEKYGEPSEEDPQARVIKPEHQQMFFEEINGLLQEVVELPDAKFTLEDLGDLKLTPAEMLSLSPWLEE
jgi:hypothetical protein